MKRIAEFIGVECTDEHAQHVVEMCSFDNMKKADEHFKEAFMKEMQPEEGVSTIYRKGLLQLMKTYICNGISRYTKIFQLEEEN